MLPSRLRSRLYSTYKSGPLSDEHLKAMCTIDEWLRENITVDEEGTGE